MGRHNRADDPAPEQPDPQTATGRRQSARSSYWFSDTTTPPPAHRDAPAAPAAPEGVEQTRPAMHPVNPSAPAGDPAVQPPQSSPQPPSPQQPQPPQQPPSPQEPHPTVRPRRPVDTATRHLPPRPTPHDERTDPPAARPPQPAPPAAAPDEPASTATPRPDSGQPDPTAQAQTTQAQTTRTEPRGDDTPADHRRGPATTPGERAAVTATGSQRRVSSTGRHSAVTASGRHTAVTATGGHRTVTSTGSHRAVAAKPKRRIATWPVACGVLVVLIVAGIVGWNWADGMLSNRAEAQAAACEEGTSTLRVATTPDAAQPVRQAAKAWNNENTVVHGHCIDVQVQPGTASEVYDDLTGNRARGTPAAWIVDDTSWTDKLEAAQPDRIGASPEKVAESGGATFTYLSLAGNGVDSVQQRAAQTFRAHLGEAAQQKRFTQAGGND